MQPDDIPDNLRKSYRREFGGVLPDFVTPRRPARTTFRGIGPSTECRGTNSLSAATVEELRMILKEDYGRNVTPEQASEIARTLVRYFDLLADIYHRGQTTDYWDPQP